MDNDRLNKSTVKITVKRATGVEVGAGVILCHHNGVLSVLTAKHVLYGNMGRSLANTVEVEFYQNHWPAIKGEWSSFEIKRADKKDIALLQIKMSGESVGTAVIGSSIGIKQLEQVFTIGHPASISKNWFPMKGEVNEVGEFILYSANLEGGYSGGPLVNQQGELLGINIQMLAAAEGGKIAQALPIDEVLSTIKPWLDPSCWQRANSVIPPAETLEVTVVLPPSMVGADIFVDDEPAVVLQPSSQYVKIRVPKKNTNHIITVKKGKFSCPPLKILITEQTRRLQPCITVEEQQ